LTARPLTGLALWRAAASGWGLPAATWLQTCPVVI